MNSVHEIEGIGTCSIEVDLDGGILAGVLDKAEYIAARRLLSSGSLAALECDDIITTGISLREAGSSLGFSSLTRYHYRVLMLMSNTTHVIGHSRSSNSAGTMPPIRGGCRILRVGENLEPLGRVFFFNRKHAVLSHKHVNTIAHLSDDLHRLTEA